MATKDRTSLKNDFANGKYATGEKFADLIDSMKVVQLPVVDPQALGTSLSFIDSISQDADGKITATKKNVVLNYVNIQDKPRINGHTLNGNMSSKELGIINQIQLNDGTAISPDQDGNVKLPVIPQTTNTITPGSTNVPTADAVDEALEEQNLLVPKATPYTAPQKYNVSSNINDRAADVAPVTNELKALGYKVLNPNASFASQVEGVDNANMIFEICNEFDLEGGSVTLPAGSVLKHNGGMIKNGTINVNKISIESTKPIFGENVVVIGKPLQEASPEWFTGSDADKIQRAIECFSSVRLAPRTYEIDRPIIVSQSFALRGSGYGEAFGNGFPSDSVDGRRTILRAIDTADSHIDCIIQVIGSYGGENIPTGYIPRKQFVSALIEGICFSANYRSDGIRWCTPGGPSKPCEILNCSFMSLNKGLYIYGSDATYSTNLEQLVVRGSVMMYNKWGIYADGRHGVSNVVIEGNTIEQNVLGGINLGYYDNDFYTAFGIIKISRNEMEGQPISVAIKGDDMYVELFGNYSESSTEQKYLIKGYDTIYPKVKVYNSCVRNADLVKVYAELVDIDVITDQANKQNKYYFNKCIVRNCDANIQEIVESVMPFTARNIKKITNANLVSTYQSGASNFIKSVDTIVEGKACFIGVSSSSLKEGYDNSISIVDNQVYRIVFVYRNNIDYSAIVYPISKQLINTKNELMIFNTDILGSVLNTQQYPKYIGLRGVVTSVPILTKKIEGSFTGYNIEDYTAAPSSLTNPYNGFSYVYNGCSISYKEKWLSDGYTYAPNRGTTAQRPSNLEISDTGFPYYDTTINKPIYWNGTAWVDGNGETVGLQVSDTSVLIADTPKTVSVYYGGTTAPTITVLNSDDSANTWLTATPDPFTGNTLTLTAAANETSAPRGAKVLVTLGDELVIINVIQTQTVSNI